MLNVTSFMLQVMSSILAFVSSSSGVFVGTAQSAMAGVGLVLVMMLSLRAMQSVEYGQAVPVGGYVTIGLKLGLCFAILAAWNVPAPGLGVPIGTWIPNLGIKLAQLITWDGAQSVAASLVSWGGMEVPGQTFSIATFWWLISQVVLLAATVLLVVVLVGPFTIVGVMVIIGPIFVPLWPIPELTVYARGYLRCLVAYSLVPLIAATSLRIVSQIILPSVAQVAGLATSVETALPQAFVLCLWLILTAWTMLKCVEVANHVTSGSSGVGLGWFAAGVAAVRAMV